MNVSATQSAPTLTEAEREVLNIHAWGLNTSGTRAFPKSPMRDALQRQGLIYCDRYRLWRFTDFGRAALSKAVRP